MRPDGFRLDAVKHVPLSFWARFNEEMRRASGPHFLLLGEHLDGAPAQVAHTWQAGAFTHMFDFPLGFAIADVFCRGRAPTALATVFTNDRRYPDPARLVTLADNHDLPRLMSVCAGDLQRVRQALAFLLTARGVPSLSWGTEVGLTGEREPHNRPPMAFIDSPLRREVAKWLNARRRHPALREGAPVILHLDPQRLLVGRASPHQLAVVFVNQGGRFAPELPAPWNSARWTDVEGRPVTPVDAGVSVWVATGDFVELAGEAERQWRTGATTRRVRLEAHGGNDPGLTVAGSGPELGDWQPEKGIAVPGVVELPVGGVFELKLVSSGSGTGSRRAHRWAAGDNQVLWVREGAGEQRVELGWE